MELFSANITGYKRFENATISFSGNTIAIIGPNEAGKSSLLEALLSIEDENPFANEVLTRGLEKDQNKTIIEVKYRLEVSELEEINKLKCVGTPQWFIIKKNSTGKIIRTVYPDIKRNFELREKVIIKANKALNYTLVSSVLDNKIIVTKKVDNNKSENIEKNVKKFLEDITNIFNSDDENIEKSLLQYANEFSTKFNEMANNINDGRKRSYLQNLGQEIEILLHYEFIRHPRVEAINILESLRPKFLLFTENERSLSSNYSNEIFSKGIPSSLKNIFELANISIYDLKQRQTSKDFGRIEKIEEDGNDVLKTKFSESWGQSSVYPRISLEENSIRIFISQSDTYTPIAERSDGLKAFFALFAFISNKSLDNPPIILIDEAEIHLHYDAQADLVRMFENQKQASKIIYTTHSAGCLPSDLGTRIRVVAPTISDDGVDQGRSNITHSFWDSAPGFSSILFAMGASILSFAPTRKALIGEGPTEMIILPKLLKEVAMIDKLNFQVAPGLANVSNNEIKNLELEAPKVVYIADGDKAGKVYVQKLIKNGVNEANIIKLRNGFATDDYIDEKILVEALNDRLTLHHGDKFQIKVKDLKYPNVYKSIEKWCEKNKIKCPSKVKVAEYIAFSEKKIIKKKYKNDLKKIFKKIEKAIL